VWRSTPLARYRPGDPAMPGPVVLAGSGRLSQTLAGIIKAADPKPEGRPAALVYDATDLESPAALMMPASV
jgi:3-oxoacyl-[acyl-carrier protein] reductase